MNCDATDLVYSFIICLLKFLVLFLFLLDPIRVLVATHFGFRAIVVIIARPFEVDLIRLLRMFVFHMEFYFVRSVEVLVAIGSLTLYPLFRAMLVPHMLNFSVDV